MNTFNEMADAARGHTVPSGRPAEDAHTGRKINLYLREDAIDWLHQEAVRRGYGASMGGIVTELIRAAAKRSK